MQEKRFDEAASTWDAEPRRRALQQALAQAILAKIALTEDMHLLDYGCGTGMLSFPLAPHVASVTGMDISEGMLAEFRKKAAAAPEANIETLCYNLAQSPPLDRHFDVIVSAMALHHIEDITPVLRSLRAMLAPQGRFFLADLDTEPALFHGPDSASKGVYHFGFDRDALIGALLAQGFSHAEAQTAHVIRRPIETGEEYDFPVFLICASA